MRALKTAMLGLPKAADITPVQTVLPATCDPASDQRLGTWDDHVLRQAVRILHARHHVCPSPADLAEQARFVALLKHLQETNP